MAKPSVYVTRSLPVEVIDKLKERYEVEVNLEDRALTKEELKGKIKGRDAIVVVGNVIDEEICQIAESQCKIFACYSVGYNNVDVEAATKHGIYVSNTPEIVTGATADLALTLLLSTARRVLECDKFVRSGQTSWGPMTLVGSQVSGKTIGIIGGGRIGMAVAQRAKGFDMNIIYTDVNPNPTFETTTGGKFVDKETLLKTADFISIHIPLFPTTRHFIGKNELQMMKKTTILINTARGPIVDEKALVEALQQGIIAGAGLDVFEQEPKLESGLVELPNVVITPHIGTSTTEIRIEMGLLCAQNIFAALDGEKPPTCLNPTAKEN